MSELSYRNGAPGVYVNGVWTPAVRFEVQTLFRSGWKNVWTVDDEPQTFDTREEAQREIDEHLSTAKAAGLDHRADELRIRELSPEQQAGQEHEDLSEHCRDWPACGCAIHCGADL